MRGPCQGVLYIDTTIRMKITEIIDKVRDNEPLSETEADLLLSWLFSEKGREEFGLEVEKRWGPDEDGEIQYAKILEQVHRRIDNRPKAVKLARRPVRGYLRYAAVVAVAVLLGTGAYTFGRLTGEGRGEDVLAGAYETVEFYNPRGMRAVVVLPDSSRVTLNADSRISYPRRFTWQAREVKLEGEAYFEVAKDKLRPFTVEAGDTKVTALGTEFNLRSYPGDPDTETTLVEGSVRVEAGGERSILEPGYKLRYDPSSGQADISEVNPDASTGWMDGKLYFEAMTFERIASVLERKYSVNIRITDPLLAAKSFDGKFEHGEGLDQILNVISLSVPFIRKYDARTNTITIN